jgi:Flp pilus assembly protein TadG
VLRAETWARAHRGEEGTVVPVFVLVVPALILLVFLAIQFALWAMAAQAVQAAAAAGGQAARAYQANPDTARTIAQDAIGTLGGSMVRHAHVAVDSSAGETLVQVTGQVYAVVPFLSISVTGKSQAPDQLYRTSG